MRRQALFDSYFYMAVLFLVLAGMLFGTCAYGATQDLAGSSLSLGSLTYLATKMDQYHSRLDVYSDSDAAGNHFLSRGKMSSAGDESSVIDMNEKCTSNPHSGVDCIEASFKSTGNNYNGWYFLNGTLSGSQTQPQPNWGETPNAGIDLTGATTLTFWARGKVGGEKVKLLCLGVGRDANTGAPVQPYPDSSPVHSTGYVTLSSKWTKYTIDVSGSDKSYVLGGFGWITSAIENNGKDITFYMDDISYDKPRLTEPRFILSYETIQSNSPFDSIMRNVAFTYDNAVALLAFTASGEMDRARLLADALVYAQQHDRYYSDGRVRNAYQAGDLALPPGWTPNGKAGTVRMPGWYDTSKKEWEEDRTQVGTQTGNVAWAMLALISYYRAAGGDKYLGAAKRMGEWVEAQCRDTRGNGGYTAGFEKWEPTQTALTYKSTEHNLDLFAAFERLYEITGDATWHERSEHAKTFLLSMWDPVEKKFWTGTDENGVAANKSVVPTDIQAWAILALGGESASYVAALDYATAHNKVGGGYDFNSDCDGVWYEGTAQMADVFGYLGETAKRDTLVSFIEGASLADGATPASSVDGLTTGFDLPDGTPWLYYHRAHTGATGWLALAELRYNPFLMSQKANVAASTFYFAEGTCRPNFDPYICIQNPETSAANVTLTYMKGDGTKASDHVTVPANSRATVLPRNKLGTGNDAAHDFSTMVQCTNGKSIIAERPMYFNYNGTWTGGHDVVGATSPSSTFYFAEGTCRPGFDPYFCIQNPGSSAADVTLTYMKGDGSRATDQVTVPANSRATVKPRDKLGTGDDPVHDFSAKVECTNGKSIIAERPMYFNYRGVWTGGSDVMGATSASSTFYFAEGTCRPNFDPYFCIQNPGGVKEANVTLTYMKGDGTTATDQVTVLPNSRATVSPRNKLGTGNDVAHDFSTTVTCTNFQQIIVERPIYFSYKGVWTGGHDVMGETISSPATAPSPFYNFAEGTCRPNFDPYITIQNPGSDDASVGITYMLGDGTTKTVLPNVDVPAFSRRTVHPADTLGVGDDAAHDFSVQVGAEDDVPIVVERPMYFNYKGVWTGGSDVVGYTPY